MCDRGIPLPEWGDCFLICLDKTGMNFAFFTVDSASGDLYLSTVRHTFIDDESDKRYLVYENINGLFLRRYWGEINEKIYFKVYNETTLKQVDDILFDLQRKNETDKE